MKPEILLLGDATARMLQQMSTEFEVHILDDFADPGNWLASNGARMAAAIAGGHCLMDKKTLAALPNLKLISCYGVGYDAIDTETASAQGIVVTHTPNVLNADVANMAILLMLATSRCLLRDDEWVRSGDWAARGNAPLTRSLEHSRVGILGLGRIGGAIAEKLQIFNCDVFYHSRNRKPVTYTYYGDLTAMAADADYLVIATSGGKDTRRLVDCGVLDALGAQGTLINVARGSVVDETALVAALRDGRLGWAGLDVFEDEPNVSKALLAMENVVLTPHAASATAETRQAMGDLTVENLLRFFREGKVSTPVPECAHMPSAPAP